LLLELGVSSGGSISSLAARTSRLIYGFDWFYGLPEDWTEGEVGDNRGAYGTGGVPPNVPDNCVLVVGLIQDTLRSFLRGHPDPVAFVHFDLDLYSSTSHALMTLNRRFAHGAILLFDEMVLRPRNLDNEGKAFCEFLKATHYTAEYLGQTHPESAIFRLLTL
jgi:hypothetical protein